MIADLNKDIPKKWTVGITVLSIAIPVVVALLLFFPQTGQLGDLDVRFLPKLNAVINSITALLLLGSLVAILTKRVTWHKTLNLAAVSAGALFLVSYVLYHYQAASTRFADVDHDGLVSAAEKAAVGSTYTIYILLLLSHILLAAITVPFVLFSLYFAWTGRYSKHRRLSRWTWPIWMYVSISGVVVYFMISPYYV